jgi:hypothetical protein
MFFPVVVERPEEALPELKKNKRQTKLAMKSGNGFYNRTFNLNYNVFDMNATIESNPY